MGKKSELEKGLTTNVVVWWRITSVLEAHPRWGGGSCWFPWHCTDDPCFCWRGNPTPAHLLWSRLKSCFMLCCWLEGTAPPEWRVSVGCARGAPGPGCLSLLRAQWAEWQALNKNSCGSLIKVILFTACLEMFLWVEKFTSGSFLGLSPFLPFPLHVAQKRRVLLNGK